MQEHFVFGIHLLGGLVEAFFLSAFLSLFAFLQLSHFVGNLVVGSLGVGLVHFLFERLQFLPCATCFFLFGLGLFDVAYCVFYLRIGGVEQFLCLRLGTSDDVFPLLV